jgi:hypothetical protein
MSARRASSVPSIRSPVIAIRVHAEFVRSIDDGARP